MAQSIAQDAELVRVIRGDRVESRHRGHAVICDGAGRVLQAWGDPGAVIYPRSSCKMVQALPLLETGAGRDLTARHMALACASHSGQAMHTDLAGSWLADLGLSQDALRCGPQTPGHDDTRDALVRAGETPCKLHNNCSGKHCGFLMLGQHLGATDPAYVDPAHPVQQAVRTAFEEVTGMPSPGYGIDGCSAPNFATRLDALGRAMGAFASARDDAGSARPRAMARLTQAMAAHPDLVAGTGRACTDLMLAAGNGAVVKTGAEAVYIAILPALDRGVALKITDGGTRAAEATIAAILMRLGALDPQAPVAQRLTHGPIRNFAGEVCGHYEVALES